jgi:3-isopropylmalate/(R)-2-methylmalate dehydratase small subunit
MAAQGKAFKYGDDVNTDVIIPARYLLSTDPSFLAAHCMEDIDADFIRKVKPGDMIIGGDNFGCGSSREHAPVAIKACGVSCVIAKSFARIFFRNSINIGLPILECPDAAEGIAAGDELEVNFVAGVIRDLTAGREYKSRPFPEFLQRIIAAGGLMRAVAGNRPSGGAV